ncbi:MAG: large subunit ribosomal protein L30e [Candidatus Woesearchaeota archaeon]|jgi:large subunit ribosomal protein L30e
MAKAVTIDPNIAQIQNLIAQNTHVFGAKVTIKLLKQKKISKVFLTQNVSPVVKTDITYYAQLADVEIQVLPMTNEELGIICKKPFMISVVSEHVKH